MVAALFLLLFTNEISILQKAKGNVLHGDGTHNAISMTEKNGGDNTGEVQGAASCISCTEQAVLVRRRGLVFFFLQYKNCFERESYVYVNGLSRDYSSPISIKVSI